MAGIGLLVRAAFTRRRAGSLSLIGVVIALAAAGLTSAILLRGGAASRVDDAFAAAQGPDLVLFAEPSARAALADTLARNEHVVSTAEPRPIVDAELALGDERIDVQVGPLLDGGQLNQPVVLDGRRPEARHEAILDAGVADRHGVTVGDTIDIVNPAGTSTLDVVAIGYDFTDCFYPSCDPAHLWTAGDTFVELAAGSDVAAIVAVDLDDPSNAAAVEEAVSGTLGDRLLGANDWLDTRDDLLAESEYFGAFLGTFAVFVLVCSGIVIGGAITARTVARRRTIGICKATGYTGGQLTASILGEHLAIGAVATLVGTGAAAFLAPSLRIGSLRILDGATTGWSTGATLTTFLAVSAIIVMATIVPAVRAGRIEVADALTPAIRSSRGRSGTLHTPLPVPVQLGLRSFTARPLRTLLAMGAIVVAIVAATVSMSITRSVDHILDHPELSGDPHDAVLEPPDEITATEAASILDRVPEAASWYSMVDDRASIDGQPVHVRAIGGDPAAAGYVIGGGEPLRRQGEAIAGYGLLDARGWSLGDEISVTVDSTVLDLTLVGWYRETEDTGEVLQIRAEDFERARPGATGSYAVTAIDGVTPHQLARQISETFGDDARVGVTEPDDDEFRPFTVALLAMMVLIGAVAGAHVIATAVTTSRERIQRTGILRSMGMANGDLAVETITHALATAATAIVIGLPLGWATQKSIGNLLTTSLGAGPGITVGPSPVAITTVAGVAVLCSAAIAWLVSLASTRRPTTTLLTQ